MASGSVYNGKKAFLVGINDYLDAPLKYCVNDAEDLAETLKRMKFEVVLETNCELRKFQNKLDIFLETVCREDLVLFYFAGHGKQHNEHNYILLANYNYDYRINEGEYIEQHGINARHIVKRIQDKGCRISIFIFDCCRNQIRIRSNGTRQGLLPMHVSSESLIAFSCAPGATASDETKNGRNGIFVESLLSHIETPDEDFEVVLKKTAKDVKENTRGSQLPHRTTSFTQPVYLLTSTRNTGRSLHSTCSISNRSGTRPVSTSRLLINRLDTSSTSNCGFDIIDF